MTTSVKNSGNHALRKTSPPITASTIIAPMNALNPAFGRTRIKLVNGAKASHPPTIMSSTPTVLAVELSPRTNAATPSEKQAAAEPHMPMLATHVLSRGADMPRSTKYSRSGLRTYLHLPSRNSAITPLIILGLRPTWKVRRLFEAVKARLPQSQPRRRNRRYRSPTAMTSVPRPSATNACQLPISRTRNPKF